MFKDFHKLKKEHWKPVETSTPGSVHKGVLNGLRVPLHKRNPVIFTLAVDLFDESVPDEVIDQVFAVMTLCEQHTFMVHTKNTERMQAYMNDSFREDAIGYTAMPLIDPQSYGVLEWPIQNIWLGATAENQSEADARVPHLMQTPAAIRWLNANPLSGPLNFEDIPVGMSGPLRPNDTVSDLTPKLDWVFVRGDGESDDHPLHPDWITDIQKQCQKANVPFYFDGWGQWMPMNQMSFELHASIYTSKGGATKDTSHPESDELVTRVCKVQENLINYSGAFIEVTGAEFDKDKERCHSVFKVGAKRSGCELNRKVYQDWPVVKIS